MTERFNQIDKKIRKAFATWGKINETDVKILEGMSLLGPRNITLIARHLDLPTTTVRYRVNRMLEKSILFLHLNVYHTYLGLKKAVIYAEAVIGKEELLLKCLKKLDYWIFLCRIYGPFEGCAAIYTVPKGRDEEFISYLTHLKKIGVAKSFEVNWTTCHEGIPVRTRWFDNEEGIWIFNWDEWIKEVETIDGELPWTMVEPTDWPTLVDYEDLLIIKELEIDGKKTLSDISRKMKIPLETIKYHYREHIQKRGMIEGYQVEIYRFPSLLCEYLFFKFEFNTYEQFKRFSLSLHDKPFPFHMGKILGENSVSSHIYLPKWEYRKFVDALGILKNKGLLKNYTCYIQDALKVWRETIPYQHFKDGKWEYNLDPVYEKVEEYVKEHKKKYRKSSLF